MTKEFIVHYGKDTYKRNALRGDEQDYLGLRLFPKVVGFGATLNAIISRKEIPGEDHYSIYKSLKDIFDAEDWKWLVDTILYNETQPIAVNERYFANAEEVDEHFAGDFIKKYSIVLQFAYKNLGEFKDLIPNSSELWTNITSCLEKVTGIYVDEIKQSINSYGNKKTQEKKTSRRQEKK